MGLNLMKYVMNLILMQAKKKKTNRKGAKSSEFKGKFSHEKKSSENFHSLEFIFSTHMFHAAKIQFK